MMFFGGRLDREDPRDRRYVGNNKASRPPAVDLRHRFSPPEHQLTIGACEGFAGTALMSFLYSGESFSPLALYYEARRLDGTTSRDVGCETRSMMKVLQKIGVPPESAWPYKPENVFYPPPTPDREYPRLAVYARMRGEDEFLNCLADGYPFVLSFRVPSSFVSGAIQGHGVFAWPDDDPATLHTAHAVLCVGYDLNFKRNPVFLASNVPEERVSDRALLLRNSWGEGWGDGGYFWMPIEWASNAASGGDAWFGHKLVTRAGEPEGPRVGGIKIEGRFFT